MAINMVLLEGRVATTPRSQGAGGETSFLFVVVRRTSRPRGPERFPVEVRVSRLCDLQVRKGDDVLLLGHLEEVRPGSRCGGARRRGMRSAVNIVAVQVRRLPARDDAPPTVPLDELPEALAEDEVPF